MISFSSAKPHFVFIIKSHQKISPILFNQLKSGPVASPRDAFLASCPSDLSHGIRPLGPSKDMCDKPRKIRSFENNNISDKASSRKLSIVGRSNAIQSPIVPAISLSTTTSLDQEIEDTNCPTSKCIVRITKKFLFQ